MYVEVTFGYTQIIRAKTLNAGIKKAKKNLKPLLGNKLYNQLINQIDAHSIPEDQIIKPH